MSPGTKMVGAELAWTAARLAVRAAMVADMAAGWLGDLAARWERSPAPTTPSPSPPDEEDEIDPAAPLVSPEAAAMVAATEQAPELRIPPPPPLPGSLEARRAELGKKWSK